MLISLLLVVATLTYAHPPVERLDDLINGLCDECLCEPACEPIVESECTDVECACALQYHAQDCVMNCMKTQESVDLYNVYLDSCVKESLAIPTATLPVYGANQQQQQQPSAGASEEGRLTDVATVSGAEGSYATQVNTGGMYAATQGAVAGGMTTHAAASPSNIYASGSGGSIFTDGSGMSLTNYNSDDLDTARTAVSTAVMTTTGWTPALDATNSFFGSPVSQDCVESCQEWKTQADMCTDDTCLCTPETFVNAQQCSECNGQSGLSGRDVAVPSTEPARTDKTMGYWYSKFSEACQANDASVVNGAAGVRQGHAGVEVVASGLGYATSAGSGGRYGNPNARPMMVTDSSGRTMMDDGSEYTNTVTATAAAMYAGETIIVDSSGAGHRRHSVAWGLFALCLCSVMIT